MKSKILNKLNKLIAHAESAKAIGSTAEAEAFEEKIRQLLEETGLTMADVEMHQAVNGPIQAEPVYEEPGEVKDWQMHLLGAICVVNGCTAALRGDGVMFVIGRKEKREKTIKQFRRLDAICDEMSADYAVEQIQSVSFQTSFAFSTSTTMTLGGGTRNRSQFEINSYLYGVVGMLCHRIVSAYDRKNDAADEDEIAGTELAVQDNHVDEAQEWLKERIPEEARQEIKPQEVQVDPFCYHEGTRAVGKIALTETDELPGEQ